MGAADQGNDAITGIEQARGRLNTVIDQLSGWFEPMMN
jgi:hypothetical protein